MSRDGSFAAASAGGRGTFSGRYIDQNGERYRKNSGKEVESHVAYCDDDDDCRSLSYSSSEAGSSEEASSLEAERRPVSCRVPARHHEAPPSVDHLQHARNRVQGEVAYRARCRRDILNKYADLLRVGELWINGEPTRWRTKGYGKEAWFDNFELAFRARLRQLERSGLVPPCDLASEITLVYWVCKLTSINYCLWEICSYIQQSLEKSRMVILETFDSSNPTLSILEYSLTLVGAATGTICMRWTKDNNIMYVNRHGQRRCKGTMKTIETQVPLRLLSDPEVENFRPIYDVDMELIVPRSIGDRIVGRLSCFNRGLDRFTDSSSLVSAVEPLMPRGSSNLRQISYPPAAPLFAEGEETSAGRRRSSRHGHAYTAEAQQLSTTNDNEIDAEIRSRRRASAQHRLDELSQYRRYIRTSSGYLVEEALPFNSRESSRSPVNSGRRSAGSDDSFLGPQTPRDRYARTGSQQSIPGEFDDPGGGRGDTFRNHSRNRESVSKHKIKTPDTGSTVTSKKSVAFAPDERNAEEQRVEAQRRLAQLQQYRRYIGNQPAESSNPEMFDEPPSRIPPSW